MRLAGFTSLVLATSIPACTGTDPVEDSESGLTTTGASAGSAASESTTGPATTSATTSANTSASASASGSASTSATSSGGTGSSDSGATDGPKFDVGGGSATAGTGGPVDVCKAGDPMGGGVGTCRTKAPPDAFEPDVQWSFAGMPGEPDSIVMPVIANLTDDNNDGEIDLCDTPDILVVASPDWYQHGHMILLDGATGTVHFQFAELSQWAVTPAIGDIDGDGLPEIVGSDYAGGANKLTVWEHDGTVKWSTVAIGGEYAVALADLDNDGDVEIIVGQKVVDHLGTLIFSAPDSLPGWAATTAADLDGDGDLEVILGRSAYHHDGSLLFSQNAVQPAMPQVANLDNDPEPEILLLGGFEGISLLEHDGTVKYSGLKPTGDNDWRRPAAIHDLDGDGVSEFAVSSGNNYAVYEGDASIVWQAPVADLSGLASGTAFDFLGDGIADAIYGDESTLFVFDGTGTPLLQTPRSSGTLIEYPVVVDVDNDGSAEIVVVSNEAFGQQSPLVQVIRDVDDRWIQARRIWNQHTYHVTNVNEDATIPQNEVPHWTALNTFRTNAQIEGGKVCKPEG